MFPRWLPLYLLGIAALTLFPFEGSLCARPGWVVRGGAIDFVANFLAFLPIGLALHRSRFGRTVLLVFSLSLAIELSQQWLPRLPDVTDLVANTFGGAAGHIIGRVWTARWPGPLLRPITLRLGLLAALPVLLAATLSEALSKPANDLSNWENYPFVIGNSIYGDRPWMGEVSELAIYDRALAPYETAATLGDSPEPGLWAEGGPILWLRFEGDEVEGRVDGPAGPVRYVPLIDHPTSLDSRGLTLLPSGLVLEPWASQRVTDQLRESGELSIDLDLRARVQRQYGPAQILSLGDGERLNLMLIQRSASLIGLIRTPANGPRAARAEVGTSRPTVTGKKQRVRLTYDGSHGSLWVDGNCEDAAHFALANAPLLIGPFLGVTIVVLIALSAQSAAGFAQRPRLRITLAVVAAAAVWTLVAAAGSWSHLPSFATDALLLGILSLAATLPLIPQRH
jgi:hypothetical protein